MSKLRFSVVTISYNQAGFLPAAIDSVLAQRADGIEVQYIVCDPGSSDGSRAIIDSYGDAIDRRIYERDEGPADGLNRGFAAADGDIFCYLNSDDRFLPGAFRQVADRMAADPTIDVLCGHGLLIDGEGNFLRRIWSNPATRRAMATGASVQVQQSTFIRAEAFRRSGGFNAADRIAWDGDLMVSLLLAKARIAVSDTFLSAFRVHDLSITSSAQLADRQRAGFENRFRRLMGREPGRRDRWAGQALRLLRALRHPQRAWERLRGGPVANRSGWKPGLLARRDLFESLERGRSETA